MIKRRIKLLGASAILIGLWAPFTVQAHETDDTWLYVAGAVAAYAYFDDHADYHGDRRYAHRHAYRHHGKARQHRRQLHWQHHQRQHRVDDRRYDTQVNYDRHGRRSDGRHG